MRLRYTLHPYVDDDSILVFPWFLFLGMSLVTRRSVSRSQNHKGGRDEEGPLQYASVLYKQFLTPFRDNIWNHLLPLELALVFPLKRKG